jgi:acetyl/propionyl-CoA carboxylase alpha subunit
MYKAKVNGHFEFEIDRKKDRLLINGEKVNWDIAQLKEGRFSILHNGKNFDAEIIEMLPAEKVFRIRINNGIYKVRLKDHYDRLLEKMGFQSGHVISVKELKAPMPGLVLDLKVAAGTAVKKGDALLVLEAMKMENVLKAEADATVKEIHIKGGDAVEKNQILLEFE